MLLLVVSPGHDVVSLFAVSEHTTTTIVSRINTSSCRVDSFVNKVQKAKERYEHREIDVIIIHIVVSSHNSTSTSISYVFYL